MTDEKQPSEVGNKFAEAYGDAMRQAIAVTALVPAVGPLLARLFDQHVAALKAEREGIRRFLSGEQVGVSTGIDDSTTYGYGGLDEHGFWQCPVPEALVRKHAALEAQNRELRALLWMAHPCTGKYGDDGEMQCNIYPPIDFKRDAVERISGLMPEHDRRRMIEERDE